MRGRLTRNRLDVELRKMMNREKGRFQLLVASLLLAVAILGCGKQDSAHSVARLAGDVRIGSQLPPADAEGLIVFMPNGSGQPASCPIVEGRYECPNVPMGEVTAIFKITRLTGREVVEAGAPGSVPFPERENLVPLEHRVGIILQVDGDNAAQNCEL